MKKLLAILIVVVVAAAIAFVSTARYGASCAYTQLEYELTFKDANGNPIEGVELGVEDTRGKKFFSFPVTDYLPDNAPKSDKDGVMRFHHVSSGVEWDDYGYIIFGSVVIETTKSPVYICRFLSGGKEVPQVRYGDLPKWDWPGGWEDVPKVKRQWNWSEMIPNEIRYEARESEASYNSRLNRFFRDDGDETPSREAVVARRNAERHVEDLETARAHSKGSLEEIEFPVIRRTIVVGK